MRWTITILVFMNTLLATAQSGPGGVGTSANNVLWLDANHGVTRSGVAVSIWNDRSGNNNHAAIPGAIPGSEPSFVAASVNGYPSFDFDGTNDQLWVNDHASIDLTQWHFYLVLRADLQKNYNAWFTKGDDSNENFEMLSYNDGNLHTPTIYTDGTRTFPSTAAGQVTTAAFNIFEYSYSSAVGRDIYKNATNIFTDNENKTPRVNNFPLYIGNERSTTGRCMDGDLAEVIAFNAPLNSAQRIIVNNYLAAKYGITLGANDIYTQDNAGNGNFDHDVTGIGRINASNTQTSSQGSGILQISNASNLNNNEFMLWGHNNAGFDALNVVDVPGAVQGRWQRVWRVSERNTTGAAAVDVGAVDMTFDLAGMGSVTTSDLRLLVDTDNDGLFADETPIGGATLVSGTLYRFAGVTALVDGRRFTMGTMDIGSTPLPIELVTFTAELVEDRKVRLDWATASEWNNDYFTVERSKDLETWIPVGTEEAVGYSNALIEYALLDESPEPGFNYYRLRQTDIDGNFSISSVVAVEVLSPRSFDLVAFPNPTNGALFVRIPLGGSELPVTLEMIDGAGRTVMAEVLQLGTGQVHTLHTGDLAPGMYRLVARSVDALTSVSIVIER